MLHLPFHLKMENNSTDTPKQIHGSSSCSPVRLVNGKKSLTPNCKYNSINIGKSTPNNFQRHGNKFSMLKTVFNTPPSRFSKVMNPFEVGTERLHLPLICSPSLFNRPSTPQMSSTHFEWNIDEMSSLNPASFEAHETQFTSTTDPDVEAKAQAAISSFFREQLIVPSPVDCPLRNQKIILSEEPYRLTKQTRDGMCQTELSLPPNLPKDIEDLLKPYFSQTMNQQQSPAKDCDTTIDHDARDASLRRKLFNETASITTSSISEEDHVELECLSPPPCSPELYNEQDSANSLGLASETSDNEKSFGSISPINLTPLKAISISKNDWSCESMKSIYNSTPECSLSNYLTTSSNSAMDQTKEKSFIENEMAMDMDLTMFSMIDDEKQLSYVRTPNRPRHRYSSRKNLSHSFSCLDDVDEVIQPVNDGCILSKTDSGFNESDEKTSNDGQWPAKHSQQSFHCINDTMDVDTVSPRGK